MMDTSPISFVVGTVCGLVAGTILDNSTIQIDPYHYALSMPSGVIIGLYCGGVFGVVSNSMIRDLGVTGGIFAGIIGGLGGKMSPSRL